MGNIWKGEDWNNLRIGTAVQIFWKGRSDMLDLNKHVCESLMKQVTLCDQSDKNKTINKALFILAF